MRTATQHNTINDNYSLYSFRPVALSVYFGCQIRTSLPFSRLRFYFYTCTGFSIPQHHIRDVNSCFFLYDTATGITSRRFGMAGNDVHAFYQHAGFFLEILPELLRGFLASLSSPAITTTVSPFLILNFGLNLLLLILF